MHRLFYHTCTVRESTSGGDMAKEMERLENE